jgi:hypothetical protein
VVHVIDLCSLCRFHIHRMKIFEFFVQFRWITSAMSLE